MPTIGIVDDREKERKQIVDGLNLRGNLPEGWVINDIDPFEEMSAYASWIAENDVVVLLIDQRLTEKAADVKISVDYEGHELVEYLRKTLPDFPIFIITADPDSDILEENSFNFEGIIGRKHFVARVPQIAPKILRAGQRFFETFRKQLARTEELSEKLATDEITEEETNELNALRVSITSPFIDSITDRSEWLEQIEEKLKDFDEIKEDFDKLFE